MDPIIFFDEEDPDWYKTPSIELTGKKTKKTTVLDAIKTELTAGKWMTGPNNVAKKTHNEALDKAIRIIEVYKSGEGLFQLPCVEETLFEIT